jgi:hypothetical protein
MNAGSGMLSDLCLARRTRGFAQTPMGKMLSKTKWQVGTTRWLGDGTGF